MKTNELTGAALDWAVAKCNGHVDDETIIRRLEPDEEGWCIAYSTDWAQAGPIIEREKITVQTDPTDAEPKGWSAYHRENLFLDDGSDHWQSGPTPLIAAMRCFVAACLGDEVDVPEELK